MRYLVYLMTDRDENKGDLTTGKFKIVEAGSSSEARRKGAEELVLDGKLPKGFGLRETERLVQVKEYKGNL